MNSRDRPYSGQPHTDQGERGKRLVEGLTMRDIADCFTMAVFDSSAHLECGVFYDKAQDGTWDSHDLYKIDYNQLDPIAIRQNLTCRIEMMMGIYPNVPWLEKLP